jgi:cyclase
MKRVFALGILVGIGSLSILLSAFQAPPPAAVAATKIEKVKDNLYVITGSAVDAPNFTGGNIAVFITDAGVVLVDTKVPGMGQVLLDRIKSVTSKPVITIINTHAHGDHTGNNGAFGANVDSIVHENTRANMATLDEFKGDGAKFLPKRTYKDKITIGAGKDEVDLYYFGAGHTNGDTFVVFPALRTMHAGDMFAWKALPYIDPLNGGSVLAHPQSLARAVAAITNVDTVIPGHLQVVPWSDFKEYADFSQEFVAFARAQIGAGKTVDQAAAAYALPAKYKGYIVAVDPSFEGAKANLQILYGELKK